MNLPRRILTLTLVAATVLCLVSACTSSQAAPESTATPGLSDGDIRTQAVGTAFAAMTAGAPLPTQTATLTRQPTLINTPTAVPTVNTPIPPSATWPALPTPTITYTPAHTDYICSIIRQNPGPEGETFEPGADFDISVWVKNTGDKDWKAATLFPTMSGAFFMFTNGKYMQKKNGIFPVEHTDQGHDAHFIVDMEAPESPGTYVTNYALHIGQLFFCPVHFSIQVK
jgi:hypothetical protein